MKRKAHWSGYDTSELSPAQRDALIVRLKRRGFSDSAIAQQVGMSRGGVQFALERIAEGRPGRDRRH